MSKKKNEKKINTRHKKEPEIKTRTKVTKDGKEQTLTTTTAEIAKKNLQTFFRPGSKEQWMINVGGTNVKDYNSAYRKYISEREDKYAASTSYKRGAGYVDTRKVQKIRSVKSFTKQIKENAALLMGYQTMQKKLEDLGYNKDTATLEQQKAYAELKYNLHMARKKQFGLETFHVADLEKLEYQVALYGKTMYDLNGDAYIQYKGYAWQRGKLFETYENGMIKYGRYVVYELGIEGDI